MKFRFFGLGLLLALIAFTLFWLIKNRSPIDKSTYDAIFLGMPEKEAMLKVPIPHHHLRGKTNTKNGIPQLLAEAGTAHFKDNEVSVKETEDGTYLYFEAKTGNKIAKVRFWDTDDYSLVILFGPDCKVIGKTIYQMVQRNNNWFESLLRFLKL